MAFNSDSYNANLYGRKAKADLAEARAIRDRLAAGKPIATDYPERVAMYVGLARSSARLSRIFRASAALKKQQRGR